MLAEIEQVFGWAVGRWDRRLSAAVPEGPEEVFYIVAFLRNKLPDTLGGPPLSVMLEENENILRICEPLHCKQYMPHNLDRQQWRHHFGSKWDLFVHNKQLFDPCGILSPGQNIFSRRQISLSNHLEFRGMQEWRVMRIQQDVTVEADETLCLDAKAINSLLLLLGLLFWWWSR